VGDLESRPGTCIAVELGLSPSQPHYLSRSSENLKLKRHINQSGTADLSIHVTLHLMPGLVSLNPKRSYA
jgi:hypothetical protein